MSHIAYCFKCKSKQEMKESEEKKNLKNRWYLAGKCSVCGTKMNKFIKAPGSTEETKKEKTKKED